MRNPIVVAFAALSLLSPFAAPRAGAQTPPGLVPNLNLETYVASSWLPGQIAVVLRQSDGKLLVGGHFDRANGSTPRSDLLRLNADGSLDANFVAKFDNSSIAQNVQALAIQGGKLYVGGYFDKVDNVSHNSVVRLNLADGSLDGSWGSPFTSTQYNQVHALAVAANGVYVGGDLQDQNIWGAVRLSATDGSIDAAWVAQTQSIVTANPTVGTRGNVFALAVVDQDVLVAGSFAQIDGVARNGIARLSQATPVAVGAFNAGLTSSSHDVHALQVAGASVYVGGGITVGNHYYLARLDAATGAVDPAWQAAPGGTVYSLDLALDMLYVGGSTGIGIPPNGARLIRIPVTGNGAADAGWNPKASDTVSAIADNGRGLLVAGGAFVTMSGQARNGLAGFSIPQIDEIFADGFGGN